MRTVSADRDEHGPLARAAPLVHRATRLFPVRVVQRFAEHGGPSQASLIAWNALTAIFPIALALAAVIGVILSLAGVSQADVAERVVALFPADTNTQEAITQGVESLRRQTGALAVLALLGFLWTGSNLFGAMEEAFGVVFGTSARPFLRQKLMSLAMMGMFAVLALLAVGASALLPLLPNIPDVAGLPISIPRSWPEYVAQAGVSLAAGFLLFFVIYLVVPNRRQRPGRVVPAALFASVALELVSLLFPTYIKLNEGINRYGRQFAFLFVLVTFFFFLGVIIMLGADLIAQLDSRAADRSAESDSSTQAAPAKMGRVRRAAFGAIAALIVVVAGRRGRS